MQLGILMAGEGIGAVGAIGVLRALRRKGIGVHAVCGMDAGAYPAALWACGMSENEMESCACVWAEKGNRLFEGHFFRAGEALFSGRAMARMLHAQTRGLALRDCERRVAFVCMAVPGRRTVVFSPQQLDDNQRVWTDHAPIFFAARAAMATPPLWRCANFVGIPLCAHPDVREGIRALRSMGATQVLAVYPAYVRSAPKTPLDILAWEKTVMLDAATLNICRARIELNEMITPTDDDALACIRAGERCGMRLERAVLEAGNGRVLMLRR